ncbi:hypothetical protein [Paenibacillus sp. GCM10012303]|uniref:hypothetical protein n=1 Tax=Paenibacillus sp. GCM10012303 TaxID=3317340 RepID=UPI003611278F
MEYMPKQTGFKPMAAPMPVAPISAGPMPMPMPMPMPAPMPIAKPSYEHVSVSYVQAPVCEPKKTHGCASSAGIILVLFILLVIISRGKC